MPGSGILPASIGQFIAAVVVNLTGVLIFFQTDQFIFTVRSLAAPWDVKENVTCMDCGKNPKDRLVLSGDLDGTHDHEPKFQWVEYSRRNSGRLNSGG